MKNIVLFVITILSSVVSLFGQDVLKKTYLPMGLDSICEVSNGHFVFSYYTTKHEYFSFGLTHPLNQTDRYLIDSLSSIYGCCGELLCIKLNESEFKDLEVFRPSVEFITK